MLNGVSNHTTFISNEFTYPHANHAEGINNVQKWFVEETRLGIPVDFSNEGIHGLNHDRATPLPSPIATASTWNKDLVYKAGFIVGREAKALGYTNVYAPILDVARDQRWGRIIETYGEDPFLIA
jgi:beta-glucosidase